MLRKMAAAKRYCSTRDYSMSKSFEQVLLEGIPKGDAGGLYVPTALPSIDESTLRRWSQLDFTALTIEIASMFIDTKELPTEILARIVKEAHHAFLKEDIVPINECSKSNILFVELFWGPSLAFKDLAMFVTGRLLEYFLEQRNEVATVIVSTSGDTGPSCLMALEGLPHVRVIVLFPSGRVSSRQALQMTHRHDTKNSRVIEVENATSDSIDVDTFGIFNNAELRSRFGLSSLNSVNWSRVLFQIPHYFWSFFKAQRISSMPVVIGIPTGAMGNAVAGVVAMRMGLPISKLVISQNQNDSAVHFIRTGILQFATSKVVPTIAPAIDIQAPYNIERVLWALDFGSNMDQRIREWMKHVERGEKMNIVLPEAAREWMNLRLEGHSHSEAEILVAMETIRKLSTVVVDPHSAVAVASLLSMTQDNICCCMCTAHPCKFPDVYRDRLKWVTGAESEIYDVPEHVQQLERNKPNRILVDQRHLGEKLVEVLEGLHKSMHLLCSD